MKGLNSMKYVAVLLFLSSLSFAEPPLENFGVDASQEARLHILSDYNRSLYYITCMASFLKLVNRFNKSEEARVRLSIAEGACKGALKTELKDPKPIKDLDQDPEFEGCIGGLWAFPRVYKYFENGNGKEQYEKAIEGICQRK